MKKTAVDFLVETLAENGILHSSDIEQAKEMFEQQIEEAYSNGRVDEQFKGTGASFYVTKAEQYYNKTFKQQEL
jgi:hypothetical protein